MCSNDFPALRSMQHPQGYRLAHPYGRLSHGDHLPRSTRMELHTRVELIDTLLEEADQKRQALHHALAAQERAKDERQHAGHDTPLAPEGATLKYEQDLWQRVCTSLTEVRTLLEDLEESERQRGLRQ